MTLNTSGISLNVGAYLTTAALSSAYQSYFEHIQEIQGTTTATLGGSSIYVQPFILPYHISVSYIRIPIALAFGSTTMATTANTSISLQQTHTFFAGIYTMGVGANSRSLQFLTGSSATMVLRVRGEIGAASNNQTVSILMTYPVDTNAAANFAANYNVNSGSLPSSGGMRKNRTFGRSFSVNLDPCSVHP